MVVRGGQHGKGYGEHDHAMQDAHHPDLRSHAGRGLQGLPPLFPLLMVADGGLSHADPTYLPHGETEPCTDRLSRKRPGGTLRGM